MMTLLKLRQGQLLARRGEGAPGLDRGRPGAVDDLDLPDECALAAIIRKGELLIPHPDTVLQPADEVLAVVHADALGRLSALLGPVPGGAADPSTEHPSSST